MAKDTKKPEQKQEPKAPAPKDEKAEMYDEYNHGKPVDQIAEERGLDSLEVLAIIQGIQANKREG